MIRVAALTSGRFRPSSRFRVRQYIPFLRNLGIDVQEFVPAIDKYAPLPGWPESIRQRYAGPLLVGWSAMKLASRVPGMFGSWTHPVTWLQRELIPGLPWLEGLLKSPVVFDVDDAIWLQSGRGTLVAKSIARKARLVVAGNPYLGEWFSRHNRNVEIVPTAIDTERFRPRSRTGTDPDCPFTVGWTGSSFNLQYLEAIEVPLKAFLDAHRGARLLVVADRPPRFERIAKGRVRYVSWSESIEVEAVQGMDVGIMPLPDSPWTRGKCSFKMLQYMACGLPVVVSPVGMNADLLSMGRIGFPCRGDADWYDALRLLHQDQALRQDYGRCGREVVKTNFDVKVVSERLSRLFMSLA